MRLAVELSHDGIPVLWLDRDADTEAAFIRRRIAEFDGKFVLAIDDAETLGSYLPRLLRDAVPQYPHMLVVFAVPSTRFDELSVNLRKTNEVQLHEHIVPNLTDDDISGLLNVLERHNRLGVLKGASDADRRRAFSDRCGRQLIVAMIEATTGEQFDRKIVKELLELPGPQQFIYAALCIVGRQKHYLTRDEVLLAAQGLPGDAFEATSHRCRTPGRHSQ
jgi:hypothetical protein